MNTELSTLFSIDTTHEEETNQESWWQSLGLGPLGWSNLGTNAWSTFYARSLGAPVQRPIADAPLLIHIKRVFDVRHSVRIRATETGFSVCLPVFHDSLAPESFFTGPNSWYAQDGLAVAAKVEAAMPGITDPSLPLDIDLTSAISLRTMNSMDLGFEDDDAVEQLQAAITGWRLASPPCGRALAKNVSAADIDAWGQGTADSYTARSFMRGLLTSRLVTLFVRMELSMQAATYLCQGPPKLSLLSEFFVKALESNSLFGDNPWTRYVSPISNISRANADNKVVPVPRTDGNGLSVDGKGNVLWIPAVDNSEFIEQEIEQGGIQPNGEWTSMDMVDPETNDYITAPGAGGRNVRQRRPRGRNKLVYTDWHNARLSFTDDTGSLELMDLSMFRKASTGQISNLLAQRVNSTESRDTASNLMAAVERGATMGARVDSNPERYAPYFNAEESDTQDALLNTGKMREWLDGVIVRFNKIRTDGTANGRAYTPDEILRLDTLVENWLTLDSISKTSDLQLLRQLADMLERSYELCIANTDQIFGQHVVSTTLKEMAVLLVTVKYAGHGKELAAQDAVERAKYLNPDLAPADQIEVLDVPFVSGKVELFPHQVKVWNYLKNMPQNVVLDVAAGGGKTILALLDIANQIGKGMRLPLVICPGNLIGNYVEDAAFLFAGRVNMVVINGTTMNSKSWGEEKLQALTEHAPPNTIFLTDYDFLIPKRGSSRMREVMYGTERMSLSLNTEFLKRVAWGGIWMDESHLTKNPNGSTNQELMRLTAAIPVKRQLSGTYISDNLTDVVGQFGILSPQTFGDRESFIDEYYSEGKAKGAPVPGAQRRIYAAMSREATVITVRRKEWAAMLPRRSDSFWSVSLTPNQFKVYLYILEIQQNEIEDRLKTDAGFASMYNGENDGEDMLAQADANDTQLTFYLQRLERFITAPASDPYVIEKNALSGIDLVSPKVAKLVEILKDHSAKGIKGKVLVWTQYTESAASLYRSLPEDLKAQAIHYTAATAEQAMAEFKSSPKKLFMVGCEKSMNTGHNLQYCSRIVRLETVWNWGTLEQGEARINRPTINDPRREENGGQGIFYDWIFANKTVDVTKNSRMLSKLLSTVKFYERDNQAYQDLPDLPPITLSKKNIFAINDWQDKEKGCAAYFEAYQQYSVLEQKEFDSFINNPENRTESYTLEDGGVVEGSGILKSIPYIPQMRLYGADKLGLIPLVQYMQTTYGKGKSKNTLLADDLMWDPQGLSVHCEYGDCEAIGFNAGRKTLRVLTATGDRVSVPITMLWVITRDVANGDDVRTALARKVGVDVSQQMVVPTRIVPEKKEKDTDSKGRKPVDNQAPGFSVFLETYNHQLSLVVNTEDIDAANAVKDLERLGFARMPDYSYAKPANWKVLRAWVDRVQKRMEIHPEYLARLEEDIDAWRQGKTAEKFAYGLASSGRKTFLLAQKQRLPAGMIKPYLVCHNQKIFLCLNVVVNAASFQKVRTAAVTGISWKTVTGEHWCLVANKQAAQGVAKQLFASYDIVNRDDLLKEFAAVRVIKINK